MKAHAPQPSEPDPVTSENPETVPPVEPTAPPPPVVDPNAPAVWPRWFFPLDAAMALLVLVCAGLATSFAARNSDLWLHMASGRLIANGEYQFGVDPFSYATDGRTWINHSWLFDLAVYQAYQLDESGAALVAIKALGFTLAIALLMLIRRSGQPIWPWVLFSALAMLASLPHTSLRPHIASAVFLAMTLYVVLGVRWVPGSWRNPIILAVCFWFWANTSEWFILGPLVVLLTLVGEALHAAVLGKTPEGAEQGLSAFAPAVPIRDLAKALILGVVACMLNPHHVQVWQIPSEFGFGLPPVVKSDELYSLLLLSPLSSSFTERAAFGYNVNGLAYGLLLLFGGLAIVGGFSALRLSHLLLWIAFLVLSFQHHRLILFFAMVAVPVASACANAFSQRVGRGSASHPATKITLMLSSLARIISFPAILLMGLAAIPGWLHPRPADPALTNRVAWAVTPDEGLKRIALRIHDWRTSGQLPPEFRGLVLNHEAANYCAWFDPQGKVFFNSRFDFHGEELARIVGVRKSLRFNLAGGDQPDFTLLRELCTDLQVTYVLYTEGGTTFSPIKLDAPVALVYGSNEWIFWHVDGRAAVLGWKGGSEANPQAFTRMTFNPAQLAFDPDQKPLPPPTVQAAAIAAEEWWEEYADVTNPTPVEVLDALVWTNLAQGLWNSRAMELRSQVWPQTLGSVAGGIGFSFAQVPENLPIPTADDGELSLQLMAIRAARRAIAANPDVPEPYLVLAKSAANNYLSLPGQDTSELLHVQVAGYRQYLDRIPKPDRIDPSLAELGQSSAGLLSEFYVNPALTNDIFPRPLRLIDLHREMVKLATEYAEVSAQQITNEEARKQFLSAAAKAKSEADQQYTQANDRFEQLVRSKPTVSVQERIGMLLGTEMVGRAIQTFREAKVEDLGNQGMEIAILMTRLKLRAGFVAEAARDIQDLSESLDDLPSAGDPANRNALRAYKQQLQQLQVELWRVTGDYAKLDEAIKMDAANVQPLSPENRATIERYLSVGPNWNGMFITMHGALGGSLGLNMGGELIRRGYAPEPVYPFLMEVQFYLQSGVLAVMQGDIMTARTRFQQVLRPQGIELPANRIERALAERYLGLMESATKQPVMAPKP